MTHTTKHTPGPQLEDIMAFFDLSDEDWDSLTSRIQEHLCNAYIVQTDPTRAAAPAMYEALQEALKCIEKHVPKTEFAPRQWIREVLAQAEGK